jgi:ribosomal protein L37AE/L43A
MAVRFKACPRCRGDLFPEDDAGTWSCLQCGGTVRREAPRHLPRRAPYRREGG